MAERIFSNIMFDEKDREPPYLSTFNPEEEHCLISCKSCQKWFKTFDVTCIREECDNCMQTLKNERSNKILKEDAEYSKLGIRAPSNFRETRIGKIDANNNLSAAIEYNSLEKGSRETKIQDKDSKKERPFHCELCDKSFTLPYGLTEHMRTHTGEKPYSCIICQRPFSKKNNLKRHMVIHTGARDHGCQICGKRFSLPQSLKAHYKQHPEFKGFTFTCELCGDGFTTRKDMNIHHSIRHSTTSQRNLKKPRQSYNIPEQDVVQNENQFKNRKIRMKNEAQREIKIVATDSSPPTLGSSKRKSKQPRKICHDFNKESLMEVKGILGQPPGQPDDHGCFGLQPHVPALGHPYTDQISDKTESREEVSACGSVDNNGATSEKQRQFPCEECGKVMTTASNLKIHRITHTGERPYRCELCGASYSNPSSLNRHKRHTGHCLIDTYQCNECEQSFHKLTSLRKHQRSRHGVANSTPELLAYPQNEPIDYSV